MGTLLMGNYSKITRLNLPLVPYSLREQEATGWSGKKLNPPCGNLGI